MQKSAQVDTYLSKLASDRRAMLDQLRDLVFETTPGVVESLEYGMPTYATGKVVCSFASQKNYVSFYMMDTDLVEKHKGELAGADCGKSCIRFRRLNDNLLGTLRTMLAESARAGS
jgi:uncharacterized protein YdhG (YjbR/CyaY superfamily)